MSVWKEWWEGRCYRSWRVADDAALVTRAVLDRYGPSIAEWSAAQAVLRDWEPLRRLRYGHGGAGFWAERAEAVEQAADRFANLLTAVIEHHNLPWALRRDVEDVLRSWVGAREMRYVAHPAGPTRIGSLSSGGIL